MALFNKSEEERAEKARQAEEKARRQEEDRAEKARQAERAAFLKTPRGQARSAAEAGDGFFQFVAPLSVTSRTAMAVLGGSKDVKRKLANHTDALSQIEDEGWRLEDVGYVFEQTGSVSRDKFASSGQTATVTGQIVGVYLFRANSVPSDG